MSGTNRSTVLATYPGKNTVKAIRSTIQAIVNAPVSHWHNTQGMYTILLLLLLKKVGSARLRESDVHPISPKTPAPQCQPIARKKRKGKRVEDYSRDRAT